MSKESKKAFGDWKKGGRPADPHCDLVPAKNIAKRELRRKQRQCAAENRSKKYREITMAHTSDKALFHKLIDRQRQVGRAKLCELVIDDIHVSGSEKIRQGWADYFEKLATPDVDENFDVKYKKHVELRKFLIQNECEKNPGEMETVSSSDVKNVISSLKNKKAADKDGLTAEHFKYGGKILLESVAKVVNCIINSGELPNTFKEGVITPVYKKQGKPLQDPNSYRRITITSILGKIVEKVHLNFAASMLNAAQNRLQRGFTKTLRLPVDLCY